MTSFFSYLQVKTVLAGHVTHVFVEIVAFRTIPTIIFGTNLISAELKELAWELRNQRCIYSKIQEMQHF